MTLLDRFRTPSRQKHPDPTVRLAYVAELPLSERESIIAAAREDEDVRDIDERKFRDARHDVLHQHRDAVGVVDHASACSTTQRPAQR